MANTSGNQISVFGYFGYGKPLAGFVIAVIISIAMAIAGIPYLSALFGLISLGFLYGVYKSCQASGREFLNLSRSGNRSATSQSQGVDNPVFLELTATALARNHGRIPVDSSLATFPSRTRNEGQDDQPPDYFEITGTPKPQENGLSDQTILKENGQPSSTASEFLCSDPDGSVEFSVPGVSRRHPAVVSTETYSNQSFQRDGRRFHPVLDRLPSYEEATSPDWQQSNTQLADTQL